MFKPLKVDRHDMFGDPICVRLYPHQRLALESWIAAQGKPGMTRVGAVRALLSQALGVSPSYD